MISHSLRRVISVALMLLLMAAGWFLRGIWEGLRAFISVRTGSTEQIYKTIDQSVLEAAHGQVRNPLPLPAELR